VSVESEVLRFVEKLELKGKEGIYMYFPCLIHDYARNSFPSLATLRIIAESSVL
jgi:hypothetical protein